MGKGKTIAAIALNAVTAVIIFVLMFVRMFAFGKPLATFMYFTTDSNILAGICCAIMAIYAYGALKGKEIPSWVIVLKHTGTVSVALTFLTVLFFLGPAFGYRELLSGTEFFYHLACPVSAMVTFIALDPKAKKEMNFAASLTGMLPMLVYGTIYFIEVVLIGRENGGWPDVYGFARNGMTYVSMAAMLAGTFVISTILWFARKKIIKADNC